MIDWVMLEWKPLNGGSVHGTKIKGLSTMVGEDIIPQVGIGIDPGRNFGIATVRPTGLITVYWGYLHNEKEWSYARDGVQAYRLVQDFLSLVPDVRVMVEGAAHTMSKGQANLAYIRMGFYLAAYNMGFPVEMVPINTARKAATGHGNVPMGDLLPIMNSNAADALGVSLCASGYSASETSSS